MRVLGCVLIALVGLCLSQSPQYDLSFPVFGFDVLMANTTFLDKLERHQHVLYTAGQGLIHQVQMYPTFEITTFPYFVQFLSFYDFDTFVTADNTSFAVGPVPGYAPLAPGGVLTASYPLSLVNDKTNVRVPMQYLDGSYLLGAVVTQLNDQNQPTAYWVGWHQHGNSSNGVTLCAIRTVINPYLQPYFSFNHSNGDRVYLYPQQQNNIFKSYDSIFKPTLYHSRTFNHLVVVDPASNCIFRVSTPNDFTQPLAWDDSQYYCFDNPNLAREKAMAIAGSTYDKVNHIVYVGFQGRGLNPGRILALNVSSMAIIKDYELQPFESYPRALALDHTGGYLYVGLYGGPVVLKLNVNTWTVEAYATVPVFMRNVWDIQPEFEHLYFITYEQHSKVARVPYTNFCANPCDMFYGYCNAGACACPPNMELASDKRRCQFPQPPSSKTQDKSRAGEVALGILFAIAFVAAAVGWFLIYKWKRSGSLESVGLLNNRT